MEELQIGDPVKVTVQKFDPSQDVEPYFKTYEVPYTREMRILEVLDFIVEEVGDSLAYQWFCGVKKCGMCGFLVNDRPLLGCWEAVQPEMVIKPLPHFPVIRDLVVDRGAYTQNLLALEPAIQRGEAYTGFPEELTSTVMSGAAEMLHCIECMICVSACPAYGEDFAGPAPMVQLARFALDPRDSGPRASLAIAAGGIDHCVSCYQCSHVCPAEIQILEHAIDGLREQARKEDLVKPLSLRDRLFGNIHALSKIGSALAPLSNWVANLPITRGLLETLLEIDRRRPLPRFARQSFDRWFKGRANPLKSGKRVVLFHDTFMTYNEPELGVAATELLEAAGYQVILVEKRKCCGRPMLSKGMVALATENAGHNLALLEPYAREGVPIVGIEPSCLLTLQADYPKLVPGDAADLVAANTYTIEEFLAEQAAADGAGLVFSGQGRQLLLHGHCHQKALVGTGPAKAALSLPPGYSVTEIPSGCCGMAGSNGFECEHYDRSVGAAEEVLLPAVRNAGADVEIVAAGISCRQQIAHLSARNARHPVLVLREALLQHEKS